MESDESFERIVASFLDKSLLSHKGLDGTTFDTLFQEFNRTQAESGENLTIAPSNGLEIVMKELEKLEANFRSLKYLMDVYLSLNKELCNSFVKLYEEDEEESLLFPENVNGFHLLAPRDIFMLYSEKNGDLCCNMEEYQGEVEEEVRNLRKKRKDFFEFEEQHQEKLDQSISNEVNHLSLKDLELNGFTQKLTGEVPISNLEQSLRDSSVSTSKSHLKKQESEAVKSLEEEVGKTFSNKLNFALFLAQTKYLGTIRREFEQKYEDILSHQDVHLKYSWSPKHVQQN